MHSSAVDHLAEMLWVWITLCLMWQGASSFMIHNSVESLCLEDSLEGAGVQLKRCTVDSELQQWMWTERMYLMNVHTQRCLSAFPSDPIRTLDCNGSDYLQWQCMNQRFISLTHSLELGVQQGSLALITAGKSTQWKSLDQGDICQEKLRSRRQSETDELPATDDTMTKEQREYLRWYYRMEDATSWKYAMLGLSLVALLSGCVLCVVGLMSNKHRREIAMYKIVTTASSATVKVEMDEFQVTKEDKDSYTEQTEDGQLDSKAPLEEASETEALKPGEIHVTWKDGYVSKLYSESQEEGKEDK